MKNKEKLFEEVNKIVENEKEDLGYYIFLSDKGLSTSIENKNQIMSLITAYLCMTKGDKKITDKDIDMMCKLAKKEPINILKEVLLKIDNDNEIEELLEMLKEFVGGNKDE